MRLFDAAYLRLTAWYVAIIMVISILFSFWVYNQARQELRFGLTQQELSPASQSLAPLEFKQFVQTRLDVSRERLVARLVSLNIAVLAVGAAGSYWLARRTMRPVEEAVEAQRRFTADASHELRTPLAAMKAEIEVGLRDKKLSKAEAVELLQSNLEEVDRLGRLAEGLMALTHADNSPELTPVSMEEIAGSVARRLQPLAAAKDISITRDLQPVIVRAEELTLDKIISILLDNAIKYSPPGTQITVRTYRKKDIARLVVSDQGIGIKASELPHIFDRFYRADSSRTKSHVAGHGLGLSIAKKLAEGLDARLTVSSTPGAGSTFVLRIAAA